MTVLLALDCARNSGGLEKRQSEGNDPGQELPSFHSSSSMRNDPVGQRRAGSDLDGDSAGQQVFAGIDGLHGRSDRSDMRTKRIRPTRGRGAGPPAVS